MLTWRTWHRAASLCGVVALLAWVFLVPANLPDEAIFFPLALMMFCGIMGGIVRLWNGDY